MAQIITIERQTIDDLRASTPLLARHLKNLGYVGQATLSNGIAATIAYVCKGGRLEYVSGSRKLFVRALNHPELISE